MNVQELQLSGKQVEVINYKSIEEFNNYICNTPINNAFRWKKLSSNEGDYSFTKTKSFDEASELMKNGWDDMANKITQRLKAIEKDVQPMTRRKTVYDVAGFQCSVPRYLNGMPNSMIRTKNVVEKQKVVTIVKSIDYSGATSTDTMIEESIKALQIVKKLEAQGIRANLDVAIGTFSKTGFLVRIRVKNAADRMNISKLAFLMVHPSMLRRMLFRWIEVYPKITDEFTSGYGRPATTEQMRESMKDSEYLIPAKINVDMNEINNLEDVERLSRG